MFTDEMQHQIGSFLNTQGTKLLTKQREVFSSSPILSKSGRLMSFLQGTPNVTGTGVRMEYPKYIRFLDMKRSVRGNKKWHANIYNRPVYGHLVSGVRRWLVDAGQKSVAKLIKDTFTDVKK